MFKGQPKGLFVLALANMGERFGYYTMLAIFVLFMQAKFGFSSSTTSTIFGVFLASVYFLPLFGGLLADKVLGYGKTIALGIVIMFFGYLLLAIPSGTDLAAMVTMFGALLLIAMGTGCFKGNLQALVGNMYDNPKYAAKRDVAFSIFYMCINIGAFFAPSAAEGVSNYFMKKDAYTYNASVPALYHQLKDHEITPEAYTMLARLAKEQNVLVVDSSMLQKYFATVVVDSVVSDTTAAGAVIATPSVQSVFGAILSPDQIPQIESAVDSVIKAKYNGLIHNVPVAGLRESILAGIAPVSDTVQLRERYVSIETASTAAIGSTLKEDEIVKTFKRYTIIKRQILEVVESGANEQIASMVNQEQMLQFSAAYTKSMSTSFNYGFVVACLSLIVSMFIFLAFRRLYAAADKTEKQKAADKASGKGVHEDVVELTPQQTKDRLVALGLVFAVVIFFWMAFHQNGLTLTFFARDYTASTVTGVNRFGFSLLTLLPFAVFFYGILAMFQAKGNVSNLIGGVVTAAVGGGVAYWAYASLPEIVKITPQIFQQFNAYFIVILTPVAVATFAWLAKKGREPLAPRKIGIGMVIAAIGFVVMAVGSLGLPTPDVAEADGGVVDLVSPNWLIGTYFVLTIAELFLSPMGLSFVSKVAPPKYKGMAQGGWLAATAVGNYLVAVVGYLWGGMELWLLWMILVALCLVSALFLFSQMKKLENTTRQA